MSEEPRAGRVLAVVVATDGAATLPRALAGLAGQDHPDLTVVGVDNGSVDGSRRILVEALGPDRVLVAERDLGFGGAVDLALDAGVAVGHDLVMLVHDDLELRPDAVSRLVAAFRADPELAVAGTKLVEWDDPRRLQSVGLRIDVTGRADAGVDDDELDQGQHDQVGEVLYVSTAGMMVDRAALDAVGRFDVRFHLFRDDLDLCWRMHLSGRRVEVVPGAVAAHDASASNYRRMGQTAVLGPRYFAERNTLATLLKNYGPLRLLYVVPLFLLVGVAKVLGFLLTRRFADAWQTVRAWAWNVVHLRETRRLRHDVAALRVRTDSELRPLFGRVSTRLRAYAEAVVGAVGGGSDAIEVTEDPAADPVPVGARLSSLVRESPIAVSAVLVGAVVVAAAVPVLLSDAALAGGALGVWPGGAAETLDAMRRPWAAEGLLPGADPGPIGWVVAAVTGLAGGSSWLAPRLLLLSVVPLAWWSMLVAGRLVSNRRLPRAAAATLYALSPPVLAVVSTGRVDQAVAAVVLPLLLIAGARAMGPGVPRPNAWRATAVLGVLLAVLVAAEPWAVLLVAAAAAVTAAAVPFLHHLPRRSALLRLLSAIAGAGVLLAPLPPRFDGVPPLLVELADPSLLRTLLLAPEVPGFGGLLPGVGLLAAGLLGLFVVDDRRRGVVASMWLLILAAVATAWWLLRLGVDAPVWPGSPLLLAALAGSVLLAVAFSAASVVLGAAAFGWRQLTAAATTVVVVVGAGAAALAVVDDPLGALDVAEPALPAFLASDALADQSRVLVLAGEGGVVRWQVVGPSGPSATTMAGATAVTVPPRVGEAVDDLLAGGDPEAASRLGTLGIRHVVVPEGGGSDELEVALDAQLDLAEEPVGQGRLLRVETWLPRWSLLTDAELARLVELGRVAVPATAAVVATGDGLELPTRAGAPGRHLVEAGSGESPWVVEAADGTPLPPQPVAGAVVRSVDPGTEALALRHVDERTRPALVLVQGALLALGVSLMLRAPAFARRQQRRGAPVDPPGDADAEPREPAGVAS